MAWVRRDIKDHQAPSLCHGLVAPLSTSGCPGPYPAWSWTPPWLTGLLSIRFPLSLGFLSNYMNSGQSPTQLSVPRKELLHWYFQSLLPCLKNNNNNNKISPPPQKKKRSFQSLLNLHITHQKRNRKIPAAMLLFKHPILSFHTVETCATQEGVKEYL